MKRTPMKRVRNPTPTPRECGHCGETFTPERWAHTGKYCSQQCSGQAYSERVRSAYPPREEVVRLYVEEGLSDKDLGKHFGHSHLLGGAHCSHLHHAIPRNMCRATKYDLRNGVPLCTDCHLGWHNRRVTLYRDIFTEDEWAFLSSVQLTGQMIEPWLDERYPFRENDLRRAAA